jgi:hypothetical protein
MEVIAAISVGIVIILSVAGISWLALRVFFLALSRGLAPSLQREGAREQDFRR